jgi:hypothetical protein
MGVAMGGTMAAAATGGFGGGGAARFFLPVVLMDSDEPDEEIVDMFESIWMGVDVLGGGVEASSEGSEDTDDSLEGEQVMQLTYEVSWVLCSIFEIFSFPSYILPVFWTATAKTKWPGRLVKIRDM